jgi:hypothetical protein
VCTPEAQLRLAAPSKTIAHPHLRIHFDPVFNLRPPYSLVFCGAFRTGLMPCATIPLSQPMGLWWSMTHFRRLLRFLYYEDFSQRARGPTTTRMFISSSSDATGEQKGKACLFDVNEL